MKKYFLLMALVAALAGFAQNGQADVSRGASWGKTGVDGKISRLVWKLRLPTGPHKFFVPGRRDSIQIWVLRDEVGGTYFVKFKPGFYTGRTADGVKTHRGQAIWGYGVAPEWRRGIDNRDYLVNAVALDECGNLIAEVTRSAKCSKSILLQKKPNTTTITTPPVVGWPTQPDNSGSSTTSFKKWWKKHWGHVVGPVLIAGGSCLALCSGKKTTEKKAPYGHEANTGVVGSGTSSSSSRWGIWKKVLGAGIAGLGLGITISF